MTKLTGGKKTADTLTRKDPDFYRKIAKKSHENRKNHYHHFAHLKESDPERLKQFGRLYGKRSVKYKLNKNKEQ